MKFPPGPYGHPITGNLEDLRSRVLPFFLELHNKYGDLATIRFSIRKVIFVTHPDHIYHILQENNRNYTKSLRYEQLKHLLGNGLLTSEGEFWLRQRRMIQPAFHRQKLQLLAADMVTCTRNMLDQWETQHKETPFNFSEEMMALTLQIVGKTLLNSDVKSDAKNIGEALTYLIRAVNFRTRTPVLLPIWVPTPHHLRIQKSIKTIDAVLEKIFNERRNNAGDRYDLLSMLMETTYEDTGEHMGNEQLRDEVMTLFVAGHETTANALSWTAELLMRHPEALKICKAELDSVLQGREPTASDLHSLPYLTMVIEESMRLYPPAWIIGRKTIHEDTLGEYSIRPNQNMLICPYVLHRDKRYWESPEEFIPERFAPELVKKRPKNTYLPFGGGPRMCIGNNFAIMEIQLVLAMILQRYRPEAVPGKEAVPEALITLRPKNGVWMKIFPASNIPNDVKNTTASTMNH